MQNQNNQMLQLQNNEHYQLEPQHTMDFDQFMDVLSISQNVPSQNYDFHVPSTSGDNCSFDYLQPAYAYEYAMGSTENGIHEMNPLENQYYLPNQQG